MNQTQTTDIARSRIQSAFVVRESQPGVIAYPDKEHFVVITSDATINQTPEYEDSTEKLGTRDITERFAGAMPAAEATLAMNLDVPAALGAKPQGYDALLSLFGSSTLEVPPVFTLNAASATDTSLSVASMDSLAALPPCGVIKAGGELIYYDSIMVDVSGKLTLEGCLRGYQGSAAAGIAQGVAGKYKSLAFVQADSNPSFTYWLKTDHFLQGVTGATINEASLSLSNAGAVNFEFSAVQGMEVVFAGSSKLAAEALSGSTRIKVEAPGLYTARGWIWNAEVKDNGGGPAEGYRIVSVDDEGDELVLDKPILKDWPAGSLVTGFLPQDAVRIGEPVEGRSANVFFDGVKGKMRTSSISYSNNISYLTDEIGTDHPESYVEDSRTVSFEMNTYFRAQDAVRFKEGYEGRFAGVRFVFGKDNKVVLHMPRVQQTMPSISIEAPTVGLDITGAALASGQGNNAIYLIFN
ncbi:MAG: hypothetical protein LBV80_10955 [Deltaproteobacteria bacterium]|nr:hypothetical protein [Deltaproteobacteria bacterium]